MEARASDIIDDRLVRGLHVEAMRRAGLHAEHEPHVVFQTSTLDALFDGGFDGDLTFAELAEHGDLGLGTLNGLDGEMIALDGRFYRADVEGSVNAVSASARAPFAGVVPFEAAVDVEVSGEDLEARLADAGTTCAVRFDGE